MRVPMKDILATCAVGATVALYLLWVTDVALDGTSGIWVTASAILVLGFVASAIAVVPGFEKLLHGNKAYLAVTSALGLVALTAGVVTLWSASETALAALVASLVGLWLIATVHHVVLARSATSAPAEVPADETVPAEERSSAGVG